MHDFHNGQNLNEQELRAHMSLVTRSKEPKAHIA